jgi:hypothetical protein
MASPHQLPTSLLEQMAGSSHHLRPICLKTTNNTNGNIKLEPKQVSGLGFQPDYL